MIRRVTQEDIDALVEYGHGQATEYHGFDRHGIWMSYAEGIMAVVDWLDNEEAARPDLEEE